MAPLIGKSTDATGAEATPTTPMPACCKACPEGLDKYYSIVQLGAFPLLIIDQCGESCISKSSYPLYKFFEPGMKIANNTNTPW